MPQLRHAVEVLRQGLAHLSGCPIHSQQQPSPTQQRTQNPIARNIQLYRSRGALRGRRRSDDTADGLSPPDDIPRKPLHGRVKTAMILLTACRGIVHQYAAQSNQHFVQTTTWAASWPLDVEFKQSHAVLTNYVEPEMNSASWEPLLQQAQEILSSRTLWLPEPESRFWQTIDCCPCTQSAQVCAGCATHTHRGAALLYADKTIHVESEDLSELYAGGLKKRFDKPVAVGIFWYGIPAHVPEPHTLQPDAEGLDMHDPEAGPAAESIARPPNIKKINVSPGIYFLVPKSVQVGDEVAHLLGRLHATLGHPDVKALSRLLLAQKVPAQYVKLLDGLHCDHCSRHALPRPPRSATMPREEAGSFAEHVSSDIFYIHLVNGQTVQVLGAVCHTTRLHSAIRITTREANHVLHQFIHMWL
eukprot:5216241-Amphidinium_carterae.3